MAPFSIQDNYLLLLSIFLFLLPLLYFIFKQLNSSSTTLKNVAPLPPGPSPWPILGNLPQIGAFSPASLEKIAKNYGPDLMLLRLGTQNMVVGSSPAAAKEILKTHDKILSGRPIPEAVLPGLLSLDNTSSAFWSETCDGNWNSLRSIWRANLFSQKSIDSQTHLREKKIKEMVDHLKAKQSTVVDVDELVLMTLFNIFGNIVFSKDLIGLDGELMACGEVKDMLRSLMMTMTAPNISDIYPCLSRFDLQGRLKKMLGLIFKFHSLWEPILQERRNEATPSGQNDFLDVLIENNFTDIRINLFVMELFLAGADTTAATIEWALAELIKNPDSMKKVVEELDRELNHNYVKESTLSRLPYLQACIKETLRLHPAVPMLLHRANEECEVMNYRIPKHTKVVVNLRAVLRDASFWDEPLRFKPERFLNFERGFQDNDLEYIPFGGGRRICPGYPLALRSVPLFVATLLRIFDWSLPEGKSPEQLDMTESYGLTMKKEQPLLLIPVSRK